MSASTPRAHPWSDGDVLRVSIFAMLGLATIGAAWFGASGTTSVNNQVAWLTLGIVGLLILGVGNCVWLVAVRGALAERRASLIWLDAVSYDDVAVDRDLVERSQTGQMQPATTTTWRLVRGPGMSRVHLPDCPLVAGKHVEPAGSGDGKPCGVCQS